MAALGYRPPTHDARAMADYAKVLREIFAELEPRIGSGAIASYIPCLARVPADRFGMSVSLRDGSHTSVGDSSVPFSIQSISKVFSLTLAMRLCGERLWQRVGREPSGDPFNSLVQLEHEQGIPRNPFINAGAICVADHILSEVSDARSTLLEFVSELVGETVEFDHEVARSEREYGFRNRALANFMKSFGRIENDVDEVLDFYFHQCSLALSCEHLARAFGYLSNGGVSPRTWEPIVTLTQARRIKALMLTCGLYDAAGEFAFSVGMPAKSGVGGGIVAVVPQCLVVSVWSPGLDAAGNSELGVEALKRFADRTGHSVF